MAITFTYSTLTAALKDWLEANSDQGGDFANSTHTIISLGETRLLRDLNLEVFDSVDTGMFTVGNNVTAKPIGIIATQTITYVNGTTINFLAPRSYEWCRDYWPTTTTLAPPQYYSEYSEASWFVVPTPDSAYIYTSRFIKRPAGLSATTATTWLSNNCADALFFACLIEAELFLKEDETGTRIKQWSDRYNEVLPMARIETDRLQRRDYGLIGSVPASAEAR